MNISPNSWVRIIKNVPFLSNYQNVIQFSNSTEQQKYFESLPNMYFPNLTYVRTTGKLKIAKPREEVMQYNYMMYANTNFSNKIFYAFILNVEYVNPNTSLITFSLDVWQTYQFDLDFRESFVEREHCQRYDSNGNPIINTIPESLDYGNMYEVKNVRYSMQSSDLRNQVYWIVFVTTLTYSDEMGTEDREIDNNFAGGVPNPLTNYYIPFSTNKRLYDGSFFNVTSEVNQRTIISPNAFLNEFRTNEKFVGKLVGCYITDYVPFDYTVTSSETNGKVVCTSNDLSLATFGVSILNNFQVPKLNSYFGRYYDREVTFADKYNGMNKFSESKLMMFPYSFLELTDFQGNTYQIHNEYIQGQDITINCLGSVDNNQKVGYTINNYLGNSKIYNRVDYGIINAEPKNITVVDDYSAAYLQGNANTIRQSISNTISQSQLNNQLARNTNNTNLYTTQLQNSSNRQQAANNLISGLASGLVGAIGGNVTGGFGVGLQNITNYANANIQANANTAIANANARLNEENTSLRGNLNNEIAIKSSLAKIQDTQNVADTAHIQGGNVGFTVGNNIHGFAIVSKQITPEYAEILTDYFEKYGYAVHLVKIPNIHTRNSWNYVRLVDANILGNIPEMYLNEIKSIFESGVTIWHTTDVGNYSLNNDEI